MADDEGDDLVDPAWTGEDGGASGTVAWQEEEEEDLAGGIDEWANKGSSGKDEGLAWDGEEAEEAALELAYEEAGQVQDGSKEEALLKRLRTGLANLFRSNDFHLEPFGSYVTNLGLPNSGGSGRSDLDVVLLFPGYQSDSFENKDVRNSLVLPTIQQMGHWLRREQGITVKNVILKARVPIVTFSTYEIEADISVQQPYGVLNSWHLRDLCASGWPGRLRALTRLVKNWAKSKSIHTAKDGALSSYGYGMLVAAFLQEIGVLTGLLPLESSNDEPYVDSDQALTHILDTCAAKASGRGKGTAPPELWLPPAPSEPDPLSEHALSHPADLFLAWLDWMSGTVLEYATSCADHPGGSAKAPLTDRYIASVRNRTQEELRADVTWSVKYKDHWSPDLHEVFLTIEEPLNGENVARSVRKDGFKAICAEVDRAREFLTGADRDAKGQLPFEELLNLPPLNQRAQPPNGVGGAARWGQPARPAAPAVRAHIPPAARQAAPWQPQQKRPLDGGGYEPPAKRHLPGMPGMVRPPVGAVGAVRGPTPPTRPPVNKWGGAPVVRPPIGVRPQQSYGQGAGSWQRPSMRPPTWAARQGGW